MSLARGLGSGTDVFGIGRVGCVGVADGAADGEPELVADSTDVAVEYHRTFNNSAQTRKNAYPGFNPP